MLWAMSFLSSSSLLHLSSFTPPPTSNGSFPPPPLPTISYPPPSSSSSTKRRRFISKVKPLHSPTFPTHPIRCCSTSSMSSQASTSTSQVQDCLLYSRAYWVTESIIAWNVDVLGNGSCYLFASKGAALSFSDDGIQGQDVKVKLEEDNYGLPAKLMENAIMLPVCSYLVYWMNCSRIVAPLVHFIQMKLCHFSFGRLLLKKYRFAFIEMVQQIIPKKLSSLRNLMVFGVLKDQKVGRAAIMCMKYPSTILAPRKLKNAMQMIHMLEGMLDVFCSPTVIQTWLRLSSDAQRTLFVNLGSDTLKPEGWDKLAHQKPDVLSFSDISIYELHIRDFSASDHTVEPKSRGGYLAFTLQDSAGVCHLKKLSNAGITHIHLLPTFQFAGVDDKKENWKCVDGEMLKKFPPDSAQQQALITAIQNDDGYN